MKTDYKFVEGKRNKFEIFYINIILIVGLLAIVFIPLIMAATPTGPDDLNIISNETKNSTLAVAINNTGGEISTINMSATQQNPRWKGFVGWVNGKFTLDDPSGATLYDWALNTVTGKVYTTRNATTVTWANINCSNWTYLELENYFINQTGLSDNISATFIPGTHQAFSVASKDIGQNWCPTLNTYINGSSQDDYFEEMVLFDGLNTVYATVINENQYGFDSDKTNSTYDFQMIVPENGLATFTGATPYYLYLEVGT